MSFQEHHSLSLFPGLHLTTYKGTSNKCINSCSWVLYPKHCHQECYSINVLTTNEMLTPGKKRYIGNRSRADVHLHFSQGPFLLLLFLSDCDPALKKSILVSTIMVRALGISRTETATMVTWFKPETRFASRKWG